MYIHPNAIFITWDHWVPSYIRNELKKNTGLEVNEYGQTLSRIHTNNTNNTNNISNLSNYNNTHLIQTEIPHQNVNTNIKIDEFDYTSIKKYKPNGKLFN
jgi:hypothetical protein